MNKKQKIITRIAPTASGHLHLGNAYNFILTWWLARSSKGELALRIDDGDYERCRREYVEEIFKDLDWLGLDYDSGAIGVDDFFTHHSQTLKREHYFSYLSQLDKSYVCQCSRKKVKELYKKKYIAGIVPQWSWSLKAKKIFIAIG
jgi:glutamyl/glutaminyl-tRNA synthetase